MPTVSTIIEIKAQCIFKKEPSFILKQVQNEDLRDNTGLLFSVYDLELIVEIYHGVCVQKHQTPSAPPIPKRHNGVSRSKHRYVTLP